MSGIPILTPPSIFTSMRIVTIATLSSSIPIYSAAYRPISVLSVSEKLVYRVPFLALFWLACVSNNTCYTPSFASQVATAPIPVSLWLESRVVGLKDWRIPVVKWNKKKQLLKNENNGTYSATFTVVILYISPETSITAASPGTAMQLTFNGLMSFNTTPIYQEPPPQV